jgi:CDP-diglyceride synthetase
MQIAANLAVVLVVLPLTLMLVGVPHGDVAYVMLFVVLFFILIVPFNGWLFEVFAKRSQRV